MITMDVYLVWEKTDVTRVLPLCGGIHPPRLHLLTSDRDKAVEVAAASVNMWMETQTVETPDAPVHYVLPSPGLAILLGGPLACTADIEHPDRTRDPERVTCEACKAWLAGQADSPNAAFPVHLALDEIGLAVQYPRLACGADIEEPLVSRKLDEVTCEACRAKIVPRGGERPVTEVRDVVHWNRNLSSSTPDIACRLEHSAATDPRHIRHRGEVTCPWCLAIIEEERVRP